MVANVRGQCPFCKTISEPDDFVGDKGINPDTGRYHEFFYCPTCGAEWREDFMVEFCNCEILAEPEEEEEEEEDENFVPFAEIFPPKSEIETIS